MSANDSSSNDEPQSESVNPAGSEGPGRSSHPHSSARLVWFGTITCMVAGAILLFEPFQEPPPQRPDAASEGPDLELENAMITQFRDSGRLKYRLRSPRIQHFEAQALTELARPDLELHSQPDPPWRMTARSGTINNAAVDGDSEEIVFLDQDVEMVQQHDDGREYRLLTPAITLYPDREYAETSQDVMITSHAGRTTAVGLKGNLDRGLLHLFSDAEQRVHTILLPDQFK
jgi:lipopolysaccharide export system protein LptC